MPDYLHNVPRSVLRHMIQLEHESLEYTATGARVSLLMDVERGSINSQRGYARIWGWSRGKVRARWESIWQDVADWCCSFGRQIDPARNHILRQLPQEWMDWIRSRYDRRNLPSGAQDVQPTSSPPPAQKQPTKSPKNSPHGPQAPNHNPRKAHLQPTSSPPYYKS